MNNYILNFGTTAHCIEEGCGDLAKVAINPENWQVSDLVVEAGMLLKRSRVFPIKTLSRATNEEISLGVHEEELKNFPEYRETVIERAAEGETAEPLIIQGSPYGLATSSPTMPMIREVLVEGVAEHLVVVDKNTPLQANDGQAGTIRGLSIVPENGLVTHLLIHQGTLFVKEFWLSASLIDRISDKGAFVNMNKEELENLIDYDEDEENSWNRLPTDEALDTADYEQETAYNSEEERDVRPNGNNVLSNEVALTSMISDSLWKDPRTRDEVIEVIDDRGTITLQGKVKNPEAKAAAEEIACQYPDVVSVMNEIVVDRRS